MSVALESLRKYFISLALFTLRAFMSLVLGTDRKYFLPESSNQSFIRKAVKNIALYHNEKYFLSLFTCNLYLFPLLLVKCLRYILHILLFCNISRKGVF